jgi:cytoskeleton protein RodZ
MGIGAVLANARRQSGLTTAQVSQRTRIREALIEGIERDDFSGCGADFYARGHIRAIARVVGVDPEPLVEEYDATTEAVTREDIAPVRPARDGRPAPAAAAAPATPGSSPDTRAGQPAAPAGGGADRPVTALPARPRPGSGIPGTAMLPLSGPSRRAPWTIVLVLLLAAAVGVIAYQVVSDHSDSHSPAGKPDAARKTVVSPSASAPTIAASTPAATPSPTPSPTVNPANVVISLAVTAQPCWAQLTTADGTTVYQGTLSPGATMTWTESQAVTLVLGNPGSVTLTINGKAQTGLGVNPVTLSLAPGQTA